MKFRPPSGLQISVLHTCTGLKAGEVISDVVFVGASLDFGRKSPLAAAIARAAATAVFVLS